eukprot:7385301-Prymnesium_polylepis.1
MARRLDGGRDQRDGHGARDHGREPMRLITEPCGDREASIAGRRCRGSGVCQQHLRGAAVLIHAGS